jgi:hypothetical protein
MTANANGITHHAPVRGKARCSAKAQNAETTAARVVGDVNEMRRAGFALLTASMAAAACGRIVTVPKTGANGGLVPAGNMLIRYRVLGTLDFVNLRYLVVFNTNGNGLTPYANSLNTAFLNFSFILVFGGTQTGGASFGLLQVIPIASGGFQTVALQVNPQLGVLNANSSGSSNEFTFTFNRTLLTPLQSTSPSPTATPTAGPTAFPTLASGISSLWAINLFSADANDNPIDAIAFTGISDTTFNSFVVNTFAPFDVVSNKPGGYTQVNNVNAQIIAAEVINQP